MPRRSTTTPGKQQAAQSRMLPSLLIGCAVTLLVTFAAAWGWMMPLERHLIDMRARWFSQHTPPPSTHIVHIDIDDAALASIGRWPWPRADLADVVNELHRAGASVIAFDLLFDEAQNPRWVPGDGANTPPIFTRIDDDALFAQSIADADSVVLAVYAPFAAGEGTKFTKAIALLRDNPALTAAQLSENLRLDAEQFELLKQRLASLKTRAIREQLFALLSGSDNPASLDQARAAILPDLPPDIASSPELRMLGDQYQKVSTIDRINRRMPAPIPGEQQFVSMHVPVPPLAQAAASFGSVSYDADPDGVVRSVPLLLNYRGKDWPHFALAIACQYLRVPLDHIQVRADTITLPNAHLPSTGGTKTGDIIIPLLHQRPGDGWRLPIHRLFITWPTNATDWKYLFDPRKQDSVQHIPIGQLVEAPRLRQQLAGNQRAADQQLIEILKHPDLTPAFDPEAVKKFLDSLASQPGQIESSSDALRKPILDTITFLQKDLASQTNLSADDLSLKKFIDPHMVQYDLATKAIADGQRQLDQYARELHRAVAGNIAIVGWTATGSVTDVVPTSLHNLAPGVVVHGAVVNSILTGHFVHRGPAWLNLLMTVMLGLLITLLAARFGPVTALILTVLLAATYFLFNGMILFDRMSLLVKAAAPLIAAVAAWVAVTVYRLAIEQRERARITRQFRNYVSRDLVDLLVANPSLIKQGRHELTCLFSDIAGFTTVSEKLGPEQTIPLLNDYLRVMTQRIMECRGTVNKYLGDGIMAFWGAPLDDDTHTLNACASALACIQALSNLQKEPRFADLPKLFMRVGIATGDMVVGDCGAPPERSDYTVIGDTVNLASRLESSNKQFGTQMLINSRVYELTKEQMLARPIGRIRVVGRTEAETVYELLNNFDDATDQQRDLAKRTGEALDAFFAADFQRAIDLFTQLGETFGQAKLYVLYINEAKHHLEHGQPDDFDGSLTLTTK